MTRDGRITMALPVMKKSDIVEIVRCDGRLVAALATKAAKLQCRLPVRGMYLVCVNSGGVRALLGRVMYL
jgi:hypothetical protein